MRVVTLLFAMLVLLSACGTTGSIQSAGLAQNSSLSAGQFAKYNTVAVLNFGDSTAEKAAAADGGTSRFADLIAAEIRKTAAFRKVVRSKPKGQALIINGDITRYEKGNATMRFLVGMGAGSSYFDAAVRLSDGATGQKLGTVEVDRNSWGLGGAIASAQTVDVFMQTAAESIAKDLKELR